MLSFEPTQYVNQDGEVYWQSTLPDGTRLYYDTKGEMISCSPDQASSGKYVPAVTQNYRHAVRSARLVWKDKIKEAKQKGLI